MPVTELIVDSGPALGSFEIGLAEETPDSVIAQLGYFGHVAVVDGPVDVVAAGDGLLTGARYVGVLRGKPHQAPGYTLQGSGVVFWLGDEDDKSHVLESEVSLTNATISAAVAAVLPPTVTVGTIYPLADPAARYTGKHRYQSPRKALAIICDAFGVEFRVNGDTTVDVGRADQLYTATPDSIIVRSNAGADIGLAGLGADFDTDESAWDYSTRILLLGQTTDDRTFATGAVNAPSVPYLDQRGNPVKFTRMISESGETVGSVTARAQVHLNRFNRLTRSVKVTADDYETDGNFRVGDNTWVYDPDTGISNAANEVYFRGEVLHPDAVRVTGNTWHVTDAMTVAFRTQAGVWVDLTRYVIVEATGSQELTVGDLPKSLTRSNSTISDRVDASQGASNTVPPKAPTGLSLSTTSILDARGNDQAIITATWTAPTQNTDNTALTDLAYFVVEYRWTARTQWQETATAATDIDLDVSLGLPYEVRVAAVDFRGDQSAWTSTSSITAAADATAPAAPSTPTVSSYYGQLRIAWDGLNNVGGAMPSDFNRVDVHVSATTGFTPSAATLVDSLSTTGVSYATAPYGSTRFVKLVAYDHGGNASTPSGQASGSTVQVADGDIATLNVGKLVAGTMSADVTISGRFATALTGARVELNSLGLQKYDASSNLLVSITGSTNLLTGIFKTALTGRRIEIGSGGSSGNIQFFAPGGDFAEVRSYTGLVAGTSEAIQVRAEPSAGGTYSDAWNGLTVQGNEAVFLASQYMELVFGGAGPASIGETFQIMEATSRGSGALPVRFDRFQLAAGGGTIVTWRDTSSFQFYDRDSGGSERRRYLISLTGSNWTFDSLIQDMEFKDNATTGASQLFRGRNLFNYGFRWEFLSTSGGTSLRMELRDYTDSIWVAITAGAYTNASTRDIKADIRPADRKGLAARMARAAIRDYLPAVPAPRGRPGAPDVPDDVPRPVAADRRQIGLIADDADIAAGDTPDELVTRDDDGTPVGIDLYQAIVGVLALAQDVDARLAILERGRNP